MRRLSLGLLDQVLSSVSSVLVVFAVAGVAPVRQFGHVALCLLVLNALTAVMRGLVGVHVTLRAGDAAAVRREARHGLVAAALVGLLAGAGFLAAAVLVPALAPVTLPLALAAPVVLTQDVGRFAATALGRPLVACLSDGAWTAVALSVLLASWAGAGLGVPAILLLWTAGAALGGVLALAVLGLRPGMTGLAGWWGEQRRSRLALGLDALLSAVDTIVVLGVAGRFIGATAIAALQGAASAFGPVALVLRSLPLAVLPEVRRRGLDRPDLVWPFLARLALPLSACSVLAGLASLVVPAGLGHHLLGESWTVIRPVLPLTGLEWALIVWLAAATGSLQALERAGEVLRVRLVFGGLALVLGCAAAIVVRTPAAVAAALCLAALGAALFAHRRLHGGATA